MQDEPSFGEWLSRRRKTLDLTQAELAQQVPCATITIQKMEANERRPSKQMAERLAEKLGIPDEERPAFVSFARAGTRVGESMLLSKAAHRLAWSLSPRRLTNLPLPPAPLIGRERDLASVRQRLLGTDTRLLTLVGPPGVGKTRLAIQVATGLLDDFGDGVYFVTLAPVSDPNLVATLSIFGEGVPLLGVPVVYPALVLGGWMAASLLIFFRRVRGVEVVRA